MTHVVEVSNNDRGQIGEALIVHSGGVPEPLKHDVRAFVEETYDIGDPARFDFRMHNGKYYTVRQREGEEVKWRSDGELIVSWVTPEKAEELRQSSADPGAFDPQDQEAYFPIEVKTGEYAERSDRQKQVMSAVRGVGTKLHPTVVSVRIDRLPLEYEFSVKIR